MKNKILILIIVFVLIMTCFAGCGNKKDTEEDVNMITVNMLCGTSYGEYGKAIGEEMEELMENVDFKVSGSGTALANLRELGNEEADLLMVESDVMDDAYNGKGLFEGEAVNNFSVIAACYSEVFQLVVSKNSRIESVADLKGKNIAVGESGSITEFNFNKIIDVFGFEADDMNVMNMSLKDSFEAIKDGEVDAIFFVSGIPERNTLELAVTDGAKVINIAGEEIDSLTDKYGYYVPYVIPAGTYEGQEEDISTIGTKTVIIARNDMDENLVYEITKTIFENKDVIAEKTVKDAVSDMEFATQGITVSLHPGAEKYYKEKGIIK